MHQVIFYALAHNAYRTYPNPQYSILQYINKIRKQKNKNMVKRSRWSLNRSTCYGLECTGKGPVQKIKTKNSPVSGLECKTTNNHTFSLTPKIATSDLSIQQINERILS